MKKKTILTLMLATLLPLGLMAQGGITEPGARSPKQLYTTTDDNPGGPNRTGANGSTGEETYNPEGWLEEGGGSGSDAGEWDKNGSPIGAPWALLAFAAAYGVARFARRRQRD